MTFEEKVVSLQVCGAALHRTHCRWVYTWERLCCIYTYTCICAYGESHFCPPAYCGVPLMHVCVHP